MQTRRQVKCPRPGARWGAWAGPALVERRGVHHGGVCGVAGQQSAGCAGRGYGVEPGRQEGAL